MSMEIKKMSVDKWADNLIRQYEESTKNRIQFVKLTQGDNKMSLLKEDVEEATSNMRKQQFQYKVTQDGIRKILGINVMNPVNLDLAKLIKEAPIPIIITRFGERENTRFAVRKG